MDKNKADIVREIVRKGPNFKIRSESSGLFLCGT